MGPLPYMLKYLIPLTNRHRSKSSYNSTFIDLYMTMAAARGEYMNKYYETLTMKMKSYNEQ